MVDAPRLVSSDASPTRPEWAVTRSTPAARAAAWNRRPTIFGESGTTRSSGAGLAAARSVRRARATPPFTNRTSVVSPSWFVLLRRTVTSTPSPSAAAATSAQRRALTSLRRIPAMKRESGDHRVEAAALEGDLVGLDAAAAPAWPVADGEDGGQVRRPERPRLPSASIAGGPPVAAEDPGRPFPGRAGLAGEAGPEARRGHRRRRARRRPALVVELGEVRGEGGVLERPAVEPGGEAAERPGVGPAGVRGERGLGQPAGGRGRALELGRRGAASRGG